jgi:hypothetical protein
MVKAKKLGIREEVFTYDLNDYEDAQRRIFNVKQKLRAQLTTYMKRHNLVPVTRIKFECEPFHTSLYCSYKKHGPNYDIDQCLKEHPQLVERSKPVYMVCATVHYVHKYHEKYAEILRQIPGAELIIEEEYNDKKL